MKIYLGSDHFGYALKQKLQTWLQAAGYEVVDVGGTAEADTHICDYADAVAGPVARGEGRGVLLCKSGGFMVIRANKFRGVRAALAFSPESVVHDREASDINVLGIPAGYADEKLALACLQAFIETPFEPLERRVARLARLEAPAG